MKIIVQQFTAIFIVAVALLGSQLSIAQQIVPVSGNVVYGSTPLCALVLVNGQDQFSCDGTGRFDMGAPLDARGMLTVQVFADGFAPFRETLAPAQASGLHVAMQRDVGGRSLQVSPSFVSAGDDFAQVSGTIKSNGTPVCAFVLANGAQMYSCKDNLGIFNLTVPLDQENKVKLQIYAAGFKPYSLVYLIEIPTPPPEGVSLSKVKSTKLGTLYMTELIGSDSDGGQWTGSLSIANRAQEMLEGILVTPRDILVSLSYEGRSSASGTTSYIDMSGYSLGSIDQAGIVCTPAFPYQLPDFVKIGDFGLPPTDACSDNSTHILNWRVEDAGDGNIDLISSTEIRQYGESNFATQTLTLDKAGNILAYNVTISIPDRPTVSLSSK